MDKKNKYLLGGLLYSGAKAFGANETIANSLGAVGGIGEMFLNPMSGGVDAARYGVGLAKTMAYGGQKKDLYAMGGFNEYNGPSHEDGGVSLNDITEVEGGENEFKGYVYSNRVKHNGKTFAEHSKKIFSKYKNRLKDELALASLEREMKSLEFDQEANPEIIKGREKIQKMAYGGKKKMAFGNPDEPLNILPGNANPFNDELLQGFTPQQPMFTDSNGQPANISFSRSTGNVRGSINEENISNPTVNPGSPYMQPKSGFVQPSMGGIAPSDGGALNRSTPSPLQSSQLPNENIPVTGALLNSIGPAAQLAGTLIQGPDQTNFDRVNPQFVDYSPAVTLAQRGAATGRGNLRGGVVNNARSSGQLLSNLVAGDVGITKNYNDTVTNLGMQEQNVNAQIGNQANTQNAQIQMQEKIANEQNKAAYRQAIYGSLTDLGNIGAGYIKDNALLDAQSTQNQRTLNMLSGLPSRYTVDINGNVIVKN